MPPLRFASRTSQHPFAFRHKKYKYVHKPSAKKDLLTRLYKTIKSKKSKHKIMKVGKPVDLHINSESECAICLETLSDKNIAVTPCGHKFCFTCIAENLTISKACPLCRATIGKEQQKKGQQSWPFFKD